MSRLESRGATYPTKTVRIGEKTFEIAGISTTDPYFTGIGDKYGGEFETICDDMVHYDYVCADIGANIGLTTLLFSQYVPQGRVLAIEAAPTIASLLEWNVVRSGYSNVSVLNTAVGDADGTVRFKEDSAYGHISDDGVEVSIRTLESLVTEHQLRRLDFVKVDVEGYEFPVFGSKRHHGVCRNPATNRHIPTQDRACLASDVSRPDPKEAG